MTFQARIIVAFQEENRRRKAAGDRRLTKTDLWKAAGLTSAAATFWFNGDNAADLDTCMKIAPLLQVRGQWLFDGTPPKQEAPSEGRSEDHAPVRLVDAKASAGKGRVVFSEDTLKILMFRRDWLARHGITDEKSAACFEVDGNSMVDAGIPDKSVVIVNLRKIEPYPKKIYLVHTEAGLIVKQLILEAGRWIARSRNEAEKSNYPDLPVGPEARVLGHAFWCGFGL